MRKTTIITLAASFIGFIVSTYLTYAKLAHRTVYCTPGLGDCNSVQNSQWSSSWGVPVAFLGMIGYLALIMIYLFESKNHLLSRNADYLLFGISFFGFIYSIFLTGIEIFVIHAFCQWCLISALCMTLIFITTIVRLVLKYRQPNKQEDFYAKN